MGLCAFVSQIYDLSMKKILKIVVCLNSEMFIIDKIGEMNICEYFI